MRECASFHKESGSSIAFQRRQTPRMRIQSCASTNIAMRRNSGAGKLLDQERKTSALSDADIFVESSQILEVGGNTMPDACYARCNQRDGCN
jgi:hypothetical protein